MCLLCVSPILNGQVKFKGNIVDEENVPLSFVTIGVYTPQDSILCAGCISDSLGNYEMQLDEGKYIARYSLIGYETNSFPIDINLPKVQNIVLMNKVHELQDVTIYASRLPFKLTNSGLLVDVQNSVLKNETDFRNILKRIPGIIEQNGGFSYLGKGSVNYYIDDREIQDIAEIQNLSVTDVQSVQLLTSPDARYASDKRVIVLIKTKRHADGIVLRVDAKASIGRLFSHYEGINWHYQNQKLHMFGMYKYSDLRTKTPSSSLQTTYADTIWHFSNETKEKEVTREHYFQGGFDYTVNNQIELGAKYTGKATNSHKTSSRTMHATADDIHYATLQSKNSIIPSNQSHHANAYVNIKLNGNFTLKWYSDYIYQKENNKGFIKEADSASGEENIDYKHTMAWNIWAMNLQLTYNSTWGDFIIGYNSGINKGYDKIRNVRVLNNGKTENSEDKHALFLTYNWKKNGFSVGASGRYEYLYSKLADISLDTQDKKKEYSNFFPSLNLSYSKGDWMHSIGYSTVIERPAFYLINNNVTYANRFSFEKGNANLRPTILHDISYSLFYKFIYLNVCYTHARNHISTGFYAEEGNSSVTISYPENFRSVDNLMAILNLQHSIKWWDTSFSATCMKSFFYHKSRYGTVVKAHKPIVIFNWVNDLNLSKSLTASLNCTYGMGGDLYMIQMKPYSRMDLRLQKWFLNKKIQASLDVNDIFGKDYNRCTTKLNNISMDIVSRTDNRKIGLTFVYYFNSQSTEYKGTSAAEEELKRLKYEISDQ